MASNSPLSLRLQTKILTPTQNRGHALTVIEIGDKYVIKSGLFYFKNTVQEDDAFQPESADSTFATKMLAAKLH